MSLFLNFLHMQAKGALCFNIQLAAFKCTRLSSGTLLLMTACWPWCPAGLTVRTRRILQEAHEEGRPCPSQPTQTKPCPIRPCYMWLLSDWSPCTVEVWQFLCDVIFFDCLPSVLFSSSHFSYKSKLDWHWITLKSLTCVINVFF